MSEPSPAGGGARPAAGRGRTFLVGGLTVLLLVVVAPALVQWADLDSIDVFGDAAENPGAAYAAVFVLVLGDAVIPILPGETTVTSAAIVAASGALQIIWVCVAASLGAVLGDSAVYWIARSARGRVRRSMEKAAANPRAQKVLAIFEDRAPLLIVVGRYVPGLRIVVNFTMGGVVRMPYARFLRWSALSGVLWGFYTGLLAYLIASMLPDRTLLPLVISGLVTSGAIAWVLVVLHRDLERARTSGADASATP